MRTLRLTWDRVFFAGLLLAPLLLPLPARAEGEIAIIASREWENARELSLPMLHRIYLGKVTRLFGRRVERYHLRAGSPTREAFSLAVLGKAGRALENYWVEQALRGGPAPPREVSDVDEVVRRVGQRPGLLGYAPYEELLEMDRTEIRIVAISSPEGPALPRDPGYPIRVPTARTSEPPIASRP